MSTGTLATGDRKRTVLSALPTFPLRGVWSVRLEVDADEDDPLVVGPATLLLAADNEGEPVELVGTIVEIDASTFEGRATAILVAGKGMLATTILPVRTYQQSPNEVPLPTLVFDAIEESGEVLDDDAAIVGMFVPRWHRAGGATAAALLDRLAERYGFTWRMSDDGIVQLAVDEWPEADIEAAGLYLEGPEDAHDRTLAGSVARASIRPGTTVRGRRIEEVSYSLDESGLRVLLRWGDGTGAGGLRGDIEAATRRATPNPIYRSLHAAVVRRQNIDGTLDLDAENDTLGGITAVPYRPGIVGCRLVIAEGENVLVGFDDGDESQPFTITHDAIPPATGKAVARVGDAVRVGELSFAATADANGGIGSITITLTPFGGSPTVVGTISPVGPPISVGLSGKITTGSSEVFIRADA
jgi:hypothetical protein